MSSIVNLEEAARAVDVLAASPAAKWIGNKIVDGAWLHKCAHCGAEETLALPPNVRGVADVTVGFDEELFRWKRAFQVAHEACLEISPAADGRVSDPCPVAPDVTVKRVLRCTKHGERRWQGHVMCDACGQTCQPVDKRKPGYALEICRCGQCLLPPAVERVGDVLGLRTGGIVIDGEGCRYQTPEAQDWTARPICYLCHRYFVKHHGGRVPVGDGRN